MDTKQVVENDGTLDEASRVYEIGPVSGETKGADTNFQEINGMQPGDLGS